MTRSIKDLIGFQIISMDRGYIVVKKNGETFILDIEDDGGGCCGFNSISATLKYNKNSKDNPIITKVTIEKEEDCNGEACSVCFYGDSKIIGEINSYSSSCTGYRYGATVIIRCNKLNIIEILSKW